LFGDGRFHGGTPQNESIDVDQYHSGLEKYAGFHAQASQTRDLHDFNQKCNVDLSFFYCLYGLGLDF